MYSYKGLKDTWIRRRMLRFIQPEDRTTKVDLKPWTSYRFRVQQLNGVGYSDFSEPSNTYTTAGARPYSNPENIRAESTYSSVINVYWTVCWNVFIFVLFFHETNSEAGMNLMP